MIIAKYDLSKYPTTFDFVVWAVLAKSVGCDHVRFTTGNGIDTWKYHKDVAWKRFANILIPICALARMDYLVGDDGDGLTFPYNWADAEFFYRQNGHIALLQPTYELNDKKGYVTITLRESFRNTHRNSDIPEWTKFKEYLERRGKDVIVLNECENAPLDIEYRMAIYWGADMNFGVNGGPMSLCSLSKAPYMIFNMIPKQKPSEKTYDMREHLERTGFGEGSQFSFRNDRQILVWEPDDYENMVKAYESMID